MNNIEEEQVEQETQKGDRALSPLFKPWDGTLHGGRPLPGHPGDACQHPPSEAVSG